MIAAFVATGCSTAGDDVGSGAGAATGVEAKPTTSASIARAYEGMINDVKVMVRFQTTGETVSGTYFHEGKATTSETIELKGTLHGTKLSLEESLHGKKTAVFEGEIVASTIAGTRTESDGGKVLPVTLAAIPAGPIVVAKRTLTQSEPISEPDGDPGTCELRADYLEVFGLADAAAEAKINDALRAKPFTDRCVSRLTTHIKQTPKLSERGLFVVSIDEDTIDENVPSSSLKKRNFSTTTGQELGPNAIFKPEALKPLRDLLIKKAIVEQKVHADAVDRFTRMVEDFGDSLDSFSVEATKDGVMIDLFDAFPHESQSFAPSSLMTWAEIKHLLVPGTEVAALAP